MKPDETVHERKKKKTYGSVLRRVGKPHISQAHMLLNRHLQAVLKGVDSERACSGKEERGKYAAAPPPLNPHSLQGT